MHLRICKDSDYKVMLQVGAVVSCKMTFKFLAGKNLFICKAFKAIVLQIEVWNLTNSGQM